MNEMTDNNLDALIQETLVRRELLEDLDRLIIADVRRQARCAWIRRWAQIVAFSFGLPMVLFVFAVCTYLYVELHDISSLNLSLMVLPILAIIYATHRMLENFSPEEV